MVSILSIIARRLNYLNMSLGYLILAIVPILGILLIIYLCLLIKKLYRSTDLEILEKIII